MYRGEFVEIYIQHIDTLQVKILAGILLYIIVTKRDLVPRGILPRLLDGIAVHTLPRLLDGLEP